MTVILAFRSLGIHDEVNECVVPGPTADYVTYEIDPVRGKQPVVNEELLISRLPAGFLPVPAEKVLLVVDDVEDDGCSTAVGNTKIFSLWGKYFDAYVLRLTWRTA